MSFRGWLESRYAPETVRQTVTWVKKLGELGIRDWSEEAFEDYVYRVYWGQWYKCTRSRLRYAYRKYREYMEEF